METLELLRIELTVADRHTAELFYVRALGFTVESRDEADPAITGLFGAGRIRQSALRRGGQILVLQEFETAGQRYPAGSAACDLVFQHFAMPVADMNAAFAVLQPFGAKTISNAGPQALPERSGGAIAYKFRDPDGHPLELIQLPGGSGGGIDHSAIAVSDVDRSIAFYRDELGFRLGQRQVNTGLEQDRLDGLSDAQVDVVAMLPHQATPHLELLAYQAPRGRPAPQLQPNDIAATRLVLAVKGLPDPSPRLADGSRVAILHDPDGHMLVLVEGEQTDP